MKLVHFLIAVCLLFVSTFSYALNLPQFWVAEGYREIAFTNNTQVQLLPVKVDNFDSLNRCLEFIDDQNNIVTDKNLKGYALKQRVTLVCSRQR